MKSIVFFGVVVVLVQNALLPSRCRAQDLSAAESALLSEMDSKTIAEVLELSKQLEGWRKDIAQLRKALDNAGKSGGNPLAAPGQSAAAEAVLKIARRLRTSSPFLRKQIDFDVKIGPPLKRLDGAASVPMRAALLKQLADGLENGALDRIKSLRDPAQFARNFIENQLKKEYFNKPYTFGSFTFQIAQKDFSTSVFSDKADIAIVVVQNDTGAQVKAHGLYFKYKRPIPEPVTGKVNLDTPVIDDLINLVMNNLPKIGPITPDRNVPITVDHDKDGKVSKTHFGIQMNFTELGEAGLGSLSVKVKVAVSPSGKVEIEKVKGDAKIKLAPPILLGQTTLLITDVIVGLSDKNEILLGLTISTVAGEDSTLYADITATLGFPISKKGLTLDGHLYLNKLPLAHVTGTIDQTGLTVTMDSDAITGGTGKLAVKGSLTKQGLDASARFDSLFGLANANGTLHLGTDGNGSLSVSSKTPVDVAEIDASLSASFTPGFKNLVFKGAVNIDLADDYLGQVTAEVDVTGQLLPSPKLTATGHIGPLALGPITAPDFQGLVDQLKGKLTDARQDFYNFLGNTEKNASKYADQRTQAFAGFVSKNAKKLGIDKLATGNPVIDNALGAASQDTKNLGGTVSQAGKDAGGYVSDLYHGAFGLRSATISTGASGGLRLALFDPGQAIAEAVKSGQGAMRQQALLAQLAPLKGPLEKVLIHREKSLRDKSNTTGQVAGLRIWTSNVVPQANGDHDADISFLVQVTSYRYTIDPKKGVVGGIQHANNLYVAAISLHNVVGEGHKPTAHVNLPAFRNVSPWDPAALLRDELMKRVDAKLGLVQLTERFEERRLFLHNLTKEPITAHVQIETKTGQGWHWLPAGPGSSLQSMQVTVPAGKIVPVTIDKDRVAQGRKARIWASAPSGTVWTPYAGKDVVLVSEKVEGGQTSYYANALQNYRFWFAPSATKSTTLHERLVAVRNNTRYPILLTAEVAIHNDHGKVAWEAMKPPTRIPPESTVPLHYLHNLPLRGAAIRFQAEDEKKQGYRWVSTWNKPAGEVDAKGYSGASLGTTLLVLEPPDRRSASTGSPAAANVTIHFPAEQVMLPTVKNMPLPKAKKLLEEKGFHVVADHSAGDLPIEKQEPNAGWERFGTTVRLTTHLSGDSHLKTSQVPDFKDMTLAKAEAEGQRHQLIVRSKNAARIPVQPSKDPNLVGKILIAKQEPPASTKVEPKTTVEVFLVRYAPEKSTPSPSGEHVLVPNLKGQLLVKAEAEGHSHHLVVKPKNTERIPTQPTKDPNLVGRTLIIKQEPDAGIHVKPETVIEVSLVRYISEKSSSSPSGEHVLVPLFKDMPLANAEAEGQRHHLVVKAKNAERIPIRPTKVPTLVGKTLIDKQIPVANAKVEPKTVVEVLLVRYVPEKSTPTPSGEHVLVPNFKGQLLANAEAEAQRHHLIVKPTNVERIPTRSTKDQTLVGKTLIENQDPAPSAQVKAETVIVVLLVRYVAEKPNTPPPDVSVVVPDLKNMPLAQAEAEGMRRRLIVKATNTQRVPSKPTTNRALAGMTVIENQQLPAGAKVNPNTVIEVTLVRYIQERPGKPGIPQHR